jgi:hypothetical protein
VSKSCQYLSKKLSKSSKNGQKFRHTWKKPKYKYGAIEEKMQWCVEKNKKPMVQ